MAATLKQGAHPLTPFHWEIEFPEVFARENGGFDAIVGNPPFLGGTVISTRFGMPYFQWISLQTPGARHLCDLVAYFFRRTFSLLRKKAVFGLIATNSISQGDTREGGLTPILRNGGCVISAIWRLPWPGEAAVIVSVVHVAKGLSNVTALIDGRPVSRISSYLVGGDSDASPHRLSNNPFYSLGSKIYGQGFLFDDLDPRANALSLMTTVLAKNPELEERIIPYVGGEEINNNPSPNAKRFAIFLSDLADEEQLAQFEPLRKIVEERVKPERMRLGSNPNNIPLRRRWWAYQAHRPELYRRLSEAQFAVCNSQVSNHLAFTTYPKSYMYSQTACVIPAQTLGPFTSLQSRTHELWARVFGSSMKDDLRYTPSDCFETFPFPSGFASDPTLEVAGRAYHDHRAQLMVARNEGMTKTYNRFHDRDETAADIARLRELHAAMDRAVLAAYGWDDLAERAEPIFLDETNEDDHSYQRRLFWPSDLRDKLLSRLLALNADRHAEEVLLGIAPGMKGKAAEEDADEENGE